MRTWTKTNLWSFILFVLPGGLGNDIWQVKYPAGLCALQGSTVIIPCSYSYPSLYKVKNLVWCRDHTKCQYPTPFVYNSSSSERNPRYTYLGDSTSNCTLQIQRIERKDSKIYRFRIEVEGEQYTGSSGVSVEVVLLKMMITDAGAKRAAVVRAGEGVMLTCTAQCSFHQSNISWYRDDVLLSETSPSLQLKSLTVAHSGNYSCALKTYENTRSDSYNLSVEDAGESPSSKYMITGIVISVLLAVLTIVAVALLIIKRRRAEVQNKENGDIVPAVDPVYSTIREPVPQTAEREDISYATFEFQHKPPPGPAHQHREDPVIYSAVARRQ